VKWVCLHTGSMVSLFRPMGPSLSLCSVKPIVTEIRGTFFPLTLFGGHLTLLSAVKVGIENCPMYFSKDEWPSGKNLAYCPAIWRRMFEIIPSANFGLNYDPSHLVWMMMDYLKPLREFKDKLFHIHIKDVKVNRDKLDDVGILATPLEYHSPRLPGLGDVNWSAFMSTLIEVGYRGPVCIEVEDRNFEKEPEDVATALRLSRNYMHQFLG